MPRHSGLRSFPAPAGGTVVTIGNFDGVHRGHQRLIDAARARAAALGVPLVAITFEPHPLALVAPARAPARLTTEVEKLALLERFRVDHAIVLASTPELIATPAEQFVEDLVRACRPREIVEGPTFNFGAARRGSVDTLRRLGAALGFAVHVVEELCADDRREHEAINSSAIRAALAAGDVEHARAMLGRPHRIAGVVGHGEHRGTELGFPTANIDAIAQLVPAHGVYAAIAQSDDAELSLAAVNIGPQPTFDQLAPRVEAHLLDFAGDLRGRRIGLHLLRRLRSQERFDGVAALIAQLERDVSAVRRMAPEVGELRNNPPIALA